VLSAAIGISALGDWLALVPLNLELRDMGGSGIAVAALFIAVWSPAAILAAPAGQLVDRFERRRLLAAASLAQAAAAVGLAFADSTVSIIALAACLGSFAAIASPAEFALVPAIVPNAGMRRANGWIETGRYAGFMVGRSPAAPSPRPAVCARRSSSTRQASASLPPPPSRSASTARRATEAGPEGVLGTASCTSFGTACFGSSWRPPSRPSSS
jgi:hypothetical protein